MKFLFNVSDDKKKFKADYGQLLNYFKDHTQEEILNEVPINRYTMNNASFEERPDFKGGYYADVFKDVVIDTKKQLDVKPVQNFVNKRKRFLSEHDGDYVHERRFDINFMESARREKVLGNNLIKIKAASGFFASTSFESINDYAREICELVNYFEAQGRSVELNLNYVKSGLWSYSGGQVEIDITVKRPDQYISKSDIYRAFSALFHRTIGFGIFSMCAELAKKQVCSGMGSSVVEENRITVKDDEIIIHGLTKNLVDKVKNQSA